MANSADVNAGDDILASQYNNLRKDVLDSSLGHSHNGVDGKIITASGLATDSVETAKIKNANVDKNKIKTGTGGASNISTATDIQMQEYCFSPNIHQDGVIGYWEMQVYRNNPPNDQIARFRITPTGGPNQAGVYWRYISASGPPQIWIVKDDSKGLYTIWECDDPAPDGKPPIVCYDKDGNKIGETILIIPPENYAELKAQCQKDMAEKKPGAKPIDKVLLDEWEIDEASNPERPLGLATEILVKELKKKIA